MLEAIPSQDFFDDHDRRQVLFMSQVLGSLFVVYFVSRLNHVYEGRDPELRSGRLHEQINAPAVTLCALLAGIVAATPSLFGIVDVTPSELSTSVLIATVYSIDLIILGYVIFASGGIVSSPFAAFYILLPTNGIILKQSVVMVLLYYGGVALAALWLSFKRRVPKRKQAMETEYSKVCMEVFLSTLAIGALGYLFPHAKNFLHTDESFAQNTAIEHDGHVAPELQGD